MEDLISIIVPVYNVENVLVYCVNSIINQTYKNIEIILVDDGSTDNSYTICDETALKDKRVKVVHKKNGGQSDARNKGLNIAKGKYISFVDSDDYLYPTFYEELYVSLRKCEADISECDFLRIDIKDIDKSKEIIETKNRKQNYLEEIYDNKQALKLLYGSRLDPYVKKVVVWNKLYKRELFKKIRFPIEKLHEDEYTMYKILYESNKIISTNKILYGYIQTKGSIMRKELTQKRIDDNLDAYLKSSEFFKQLNERELEMKSRRRYLENCIELVGKITKNDNENKESQILQLSNLYKIHYEAYINLIKENTKDEREHEIIKVIDGAYKSIQTEGKIDSQYWNVLGEIINKK